MDCTGKLISVNRDWQSNKLNITLQIEEQPTDDINYISSCEKLNISIKRFTKKRSLDANAYCWVLCTKIANHPDIRSSKEEVYEEMLQKYGVLYQDEDGYITVTVKSSVDMSKIEGHWKHYKGNGQFDSYIMIKGTSQYDTSEMARFIDMIIHEAKELGIETLPPYELERMLSQWGKTNEKVV